MKYRIALSAVTRDAPCDLRSLSQQVLCGDPSTVRAWAAGQSIANLNQEVSALSPDLRKRLPQLVLDTNAMGALRDRFLRVMDKVLATPELGFYLEIFSYTRYNIQGGGFFGTCNNVYLGESPYSGLSDKDALNVLVHESFHSFNCVNGGPSGALDEGSAIVIYKFAFPELFSPSEDWAEATYGSKLYYRDIGVGGKQPDYPILAPRAPTPKLNEVYRWLSSRDRSKLPWNSTEKLRRCFDAHFSSINRDVDFFAVWLPAANSASLRMLTDPGCRPD